MLQANHLSYSYGSKTILKDISFSLAYGESVCLLGKNGVGKSTLFKCLLGILSPLSGSVCVDGVSLSGKRVQERSQLISYIPQKQQSIFHFTVFEMVLMGTAARLKSWQQPQEEEYKIASQALKLLKIEHLRNQRFSEISGGEQQLTIIARSIAQQAQIIIMDEPCASLDFGNQVMVLEMIQHLSQAGYLILQATHDPNHALQYADQVLLLEAGRLISGAPQKILTGERLEQLYGVPITVHTTKTGQQLCSASVQSKERSYVENV